MGIETILEYLNAVPVRATYGAVGDVLGVRPQVVPRLLGAPRPEASWIVNGSTGEPTGYGPDQVDPRLPGTRVIRTGDELRRCLESGTPAAAAPDPAPAVKVNDVAGGGLPETEALEIGGDAKWIIGTLVPVFLLVAGLLAAQIASVNRSLNARIDDVNARIDDLRADLTAEIAGLHARIDDVRTEFNDQIAALGSDVRGAAPPAPVEETLDTSDPRAVPAPDESEQAVEPDAPTADPDTPAADPELPQESPADPVAPAANPVPPPE